jgi:hypothetical protein
MLFALNANENELFFWEQQHAVKMARKRVEKSSKKMSMMIGPWRVCWPHENEFITLSTAQLEARPKMK